VNKTGIKRAIVAAGSQVNLARHLGVSPPAVCMWLRRGWVPLRRAMEIETLFGVSRSLTMNPRVKVLVDLSSGVSL
jgi:DNA-binding transcriptional regulator YdaS (Cro superfamily)